PGQRTAQDCHPEERSDEGSALSPLYPFITRIDGQGDISASGFNSGLNDFGDALLTRSLSLS
ncbi:MAG: hypothetical protein ACYCXJ_10320, partial [Thermoleophilia bacterium]